MSRLQFSKRLFDTACLLSLAGIWPRFIEPKRLQLSSHTLKIPRLPQEKLTVLQLSDLHLSPYLSDRFLNKITQHANDLKPDLIVYTGDFLCQSRIGDKKRLQKFLSSFSAPLGCFAILGNHDYDRYICINRSGAYDILDQSPQMKIVRLLRKQIKLKGKTTEKAFTPPFHSELIELLNASPFQLLHNETVQLSNGMNLSGLGEYMAGHCDPKKAFTNYNPKNPGITLLHNPDGIPLLKNHPGNLILCGHTHGAQINLPYIRERLTPLENPQYKRGLLRENEKWIYINRGLSGTSPVRLFSPPEMTHFILEKS